MALFSDSKGRKDGKSGYGRLFGNDELGRLISRVHATSIRYGTELERLIKDRVKLIDDLDTFLLQEIMPDGVLVADKREIKRCRKLDLNNQEPDFVIFKRRLNKQACHLVELKDGDTFDTKKAAAEYRAMHEFVSKNAPEIPYTVQTHFACFNQNDKNAIITGFKQKITPEEAMTGREFCELLELDYDSIIQERQRDGAQNLSDFLDVLVKIAPVRTILKRLLGP